MIGREEELKGYRDRAPLFLLVVILALGMILVRVFYLQILRGDELRNFSEANRLKKERLAPPRGILYDRDGVVIVDNRASFDVVMFSQYFPFKDQAVHQRLANALQMPLEALEKRIKKAKGVAAFHSTLLKADVSKDVIAAIEMDAEGFPGVDIEASVRRQYPYGDLSSQLLGFVGEVNRNDLEKHPNMEQGDSIGRRGIELRYDRYLRGINGVGFVEVDARGHRRRASQNGQKLLGYVAQTDPVPGENLYLTVDKDVELAARKAMMDREFTGSVVAIDPRTGEVLAMVNSPSYNPDLISGREIEPKVWAELSQDKERPLRNRALQDHYPPGSTFKLFLAVAGLAEGIIDKNSTVDCKGHMQFGRRRFHCWKRHGRVDFFGSIRESCDIFYYELGNKLGIDRLAKYARMFGLGSKTGIAMKGEVPGIIPDTEWKKKRFNDIWHPGETLSVAIGQGYVTVNPLQLALAFAAIGNGGFVYRPYIVKRVERRDGAVLKEFQPELIRKIDVASEVFERVKEGLFQVVNAPWGTGARSRSDITLLSGKTGTAQVVRFADIASIKCEEQERRFRHHGLFAGYAPRDNPEIAVVAVAEHSCHGSSAGPVVKEVVEAYMRKKAEQNNIPIEELKEDTKAKMAEYRENHPKLIQAARERAERIREARRKREEAAAAREMAKEPLNKEQAIRPGT